nr:type IV pilus biogenesis protein PilF [uncultured bacterium]QLG20603.1 type IV pilus biogenesis protein PilF [uncultured bacterium]
MNFLTTRLMGGLIGFALLVSGCATTGVGNSVRQEGAQLPVSEQTPKNETQQRAKVHTELGALYFVDGRAAVALEEARIALSVDANYAPAYNLLGLVHMSLNEPRLAEENFRQALRIAPGDPEINNNFGWFLCQTNREKQAMAHFDLSAANPLYSTPTKPNTNAGICAIRMKDDKAAAAYLLEALRLAPENTQAMYWLADMDYRQGNYLEARRWLSGIEKLQELDATLTWLALRIERKLGNREAEARLAMQLRKRFANSPEQRLLSQEAYE